MADGRVVFEVVGDDRDVNKTIKRVTDNIKKESKEWDKAAAESTGNISDLFKGMVKGIVGTLSAAAVVNIIRKWSSAAVQAASDLAEVQNVVDVTFGEGADRINTWSKEAGKAYGLTETKAKRYTSTIGAMLKSQGMADDQIVKMSTDLAGLTADMASFYNLDHDEAFQKIRSGISGETEPLKQLGINMSAANLEAFRLSQGIEKAYSAMSQSEQTALRYQYIMQATADAQGDFARTADGFANASRRIETAMDTIKTKGGQLVLPVIEKLTGGLADFLEKLTTQPETTVLDDFANIDADTSAKMANLQATYDKAQNVIGILKDIESMTTTLADGSTTTFGDLFKGIADIEKGGGNVQEYIAGLGLDVDFVIQKYNVWKESTRQLTSLIPSLTSVIDSETGAIDGGTAALDKNLEAWRANEEKKIAWSAYYAKERALAEKKGEMYLYEFDAGAAREAAKRYREKLQKEYAATFDESGAISYKTAVAMSGAGPDSQWFKDVREYNGLLLKQKETEEQLTEQTVDYSKAEQQLADGKQALIEKYGEEEKAAAGATTETGKYLNKTTTEWNDLTGAVNESLKALADYVQGVRDATEQTVNSVVKGFEKIQRPTTELEIKRSKLIEQQLSLNRSTEEGEKKYQDLQQQIDELNKSMDEYSPKGMQDALKSQIAFMDEYIQNLEEAQKMGLSNDLLASLSDGSVQSAEYLAALVANPNQAKEVDALYQQVQKKKQGFVDALTDQKLEADDTYASIVETAKNAVAQLDQGEEAKTATGKTIEGIAQGISDNVPEVRTAVNSILDELNRLSDFGVNISIPGFGALESGISFQGTSAAPSGINYDLLGDVMKSSIPGNVYMDGRKVGRMISDQQGKDFRALQRSGWQAP